MIQTLTDLILNLKLADDWVAFIPSSYSSRVQEASSAVSPSNVVVYVRVHGKKWLESTRVWAP